MYDEEYFIIIARTVAKALRWNHLWRGVWLPKSADIHIGTRVHRLANGRDDPQVIFELTKEAVDAELEATKTCGFVPFHMFLAYRGYDA